VIDLKEERKRLKKLKAPERELSALADEIISKEKVVRELEGQAADIDAAVFDLKAVNPSTVAKFDDRSPAEIIQSIHAHGRMVADALSRLASLVNDNRTDVRKVSSASRRGAS
jgi:type I restriction enzyme M protein